MAKINLASRVLKGATFLDEKVPGWAGKINVKTLKMNSDTDCVLGQLAGKAKTNAFAYADTLGMKKAQIATLGFEVLDVADQDEAHAQLWKDQIASRLEVAKPKKAAKKTLAAK